MKGFRVVGKRLLLLFVVAWIAAAAEAPVRGDAPISLRSVGDAGKWEGPVPQVALELVAEGFSQPVQVTYAPGDPDRLFVVEKTGAIRVLEKGRIAPEPLLDLRGQVSGGYEQGLLSLAFHPDFAHNRSFFVNYTDRRGDTIVARYRTRGGAYAADPRSREALLAIDQPASNHNGGMMAFGPDGYLYIGTGDGGRAGDPWNNGQNLGVLLGKILRIDVDAGAPYAIPADNPFVGSPGARGEIWAWGLRNPWRFSFDRTTGDLYIADVGQNAWEEVNLEPKASGGGANYGWNRMEGGHCYPASRTSCPGEFVLPVVEYGRALGCSVTGGYVYRGREIPDLGGVYVFGDFCSGRIWGFRPGGSGGASQAGAVVELLSSGMSISSFGEDARGELYVTHMTAGRIYRLVPSE